MTDFLPLYRICSAVELSHYDAVQVPVLWPWELCIRTREKRPENPSSGQIAEWLPDEGRTNISVSDTNLPGSLYSAGNSLTWPLLTNPGWCSRLACRIYPAFAYLMAYQWSHFPSKMHWWDFCILYIQRALALGITIFLNNYNHRSSETLASCQNLSLIQYFASFLFAIKPSYPISFLEKPVMSII